MRKGGVALTIWLMTGLWSALYHVVLLPVKFVQTRHSAQRHPGCRVGDSHLLVVAFADWPPALRRARMGLEKRYRAFLANDERERREHVKGTQASTRLPLDDEGERNMQFWDLWTPEEKEVQRERERLRDSWCPKRVAVASQERWGAKRRRSSDPIRQLGELCSLEPIVGVYHCERIWFSSTLSCIGEAEKITKPLVGSSVHFNHQTSRGLFSHFNHQTSRGIFSHFNHQTSRGLFSPFQSTRQHWTTHGLELVFSTCLNS